MDCLLDCRVDRSGALTWLKDAFTPQGVKDAGLLGIVEEFPGIANLTWPPSLVAGCWVLRWAW